MKKIIFALIALLTLETGSFNLLAQDRSHRLTDSRLMTMPIGTYEKTYLNLGVSHVPEIKSINDIAYSDTIVANFFFDRLARSVDPKKVVLVTEYPVLEGVGGKIQTSHSWWITKHMRSLGFSKWVAADMRPASSIVYNRSLRYVLEVLHTYFTVEAVEDQSDFYGIMQTKYHQKKELPQEVVDRMIRSLTAVAEARSFETNIKRACNLLREQGYIPVVVAGGSHVLALYEPCLIQTNKDKDKSMEKLMSDISLIRGEDFILDYFLEKYNLMIVNQTTGEKTIR